jgi:hypothetical protein
VLTTEELAKVRDDLVSRLEQLDAMRDELVEVLASLRIAMGEEEQPVKPAHGKARTKAAPRPRTAS